MKYTLSLATKGMNRIKAVLLSFFLLAITQMADAQNVIWANATICADNNYSMQNICTDYSGSNYTAGRFTKTVDFDEGPGVDTIKANIIVANGVWAGFISKSDNNGNHLWAKAIIPYASNAQCTVFDVSADNNNNVYLTGIFNKTVDFDPGPAVDSLNSSGLKGSFIMKLDAAGNLIWARTFVNPDLIMWAVKADQNGDVVVSGTFKDTCDFDPGPAVYNVIANNDLFALKIDGNGNFSGQKTGDYTYIGTAFKGNLDVDMTGNIYVSGRPFSNPVDLDPGPGVVADSGNSFIVKLDPAGNFVWGKALDAYHCMLTISKFGYLLLSGTPYGFANNSFVAKYDLTGTELWTKMLSDSLVPGQYFKGKIFDFTEDTLGNIVMAGHTFYTSCLYQTDSGGNFLWRKVNTSSIINELCVKVNITNDLIVGGEMQNVADVDFGPGIDTIGVAGKVSFFLMKYKYCGNNYTMNYDGCDSLVLPDTTYLANAYYLKEYLDINNCDSNVFTHVTLHVLPDILINACDTAVYNGQIYTQTGVYTQVVPNAFGCDSVVIVTVNINTPAAGLPPFLNLIQTFQPYYPPAGVPGNASSSSHTIEIDSLYNMYIGGSFGQLTDFNPLGSPYLDSAFDAYPVPDAFVTRYDSAGQLTWMHKIWTMDAWGIEDTRSLALNDNLDLYSVTIGTNVGSVWEQSSVNIFNFANVYYGNSLNITPVDIVHQVLNDPTSNKIVKIGYHDSIFNGNEHMKKLKVQRGNNVVIFTNPYYIDAYNGAIDAQGNIYVCSNGCIAKLDSNLNMLWVKYSGAGYKLKINTLKIDNDGSLLLCGDFLDSVDVDFSPNTYNLISNGDRDAYIARFDSSANLIWAHSWGGSADDAAIGLTTDQIGKIYIGGGFASTAIDLDPTAGISFLMKGCANSDWEGGYISKFKPDGTFMKVMGSGSNITELEFKAPKRIYATGNPFVQVFELGNDIIVNVSDTICAGDSVTVGNSVYYQSGVYTAIFPLAPAIDSIVITNLTVNPLPTVIANASDTSICIGDSVILFGSGANTYAWNNLVIDNVIFSPNVTNTYLVSGTDINGCVNTDSITVVVNALPTVIANASDTLLCFGDSIILFGSGALTYTWNNLAIDNVLFAPLATGYFVVTGTDTNGCMNTDSIEIMVNALPAVIANASDTSLCIGDSLMLFGSGALTYVWNNLVLDSIIFSPNITNTYLVTGTDINGCINTDSITVTVNALPNVVANASDTSICIGNPVILFGTGADSFSWTNPVIDSVAFYPIDTAMYVVTGIDLNGCVNTDSIEVFTFQIPFPILVFSGDTLYCTNVTGVTYYWFKDTVAVDSLINYYVVTQNGNYEVLVVDSNGCVGADSISMLNIGYLTPSKSNMIQVYPNPTSNDINIAFEMNKTGEVELMINDLLGNKIYASKRKITSQGKQLLKIDLPKNNLNTGVYFLNIIIEGKRHVVKIEFQK